MPISLDIIKAQSEPLAATAAALGFFDGVHRGHARVLQLTAKLAAEQGLHSLAFTFSNHPASIIRPFGVPLLLTDFEERCRLLESFTQQCIFAEFDRAFSIMAPERFVKLILHDYLRVRQVVVGPNYNFGLGAKGDVQLLQTLAPKYGYQLHVVPPLTFDDGQTQRFISSSAVRQLVKDGQVKMAGQLMGHPYQVCGQVFQGQQLGRQMQVPTANLRIPTQRAVPKAGVYAVWAQVAGQRLPAAAYYGSRPTFGGSETWLEVHWLTTEDWREAGGSGPCPYCDLSQNYNLYGYNLKVEFIAMLRNERHFASPLLLQQQIFEDKRAAFLSLGLLK